MNKQDFTTKDGVLSFLSSFWAVAFPDQGFVHGIGRTHAQRACQVYQDAIEIINTTSVRDVPLYHRETFVPLTLLESEMSIGPLPISYGTGIVHGEQPSGSIYREGEIFEFGGKEKLTPFYYFELPAKVVSIGSVVTERLVNPRTLLALDRDFLTIEDRIIAFKTNPFTSGEFPIRHTGDDRMIVAWASEVCFDHNYLHRRWGYPFFSSEASTEALREFCKTLFALYTGGPSRLMLDAFVAAMARQPVIAEMEETIEEVSVFNGERIIVTDKSVYHVDLDISLRDYIVPGRTLKAGSPLTTVTRVDDAISDPAWWTTEGGLMLDIGLQHPKYFGGPIYFPNSVVQATSSGTESARFELAGSDEALKKFWEKVDQGSPEGKFLGTELWKKHGVVDDNGDADLSRPLLINPMGFLVNDIFGVSLIAVRVIGGKVPFMDEFLKNLENLRRGTTPIALLVFFIDYQLSDEYDSPGDAGSMTVATGLGLYEEDIDLSGLEEEFNVKQSIAC